MVRGTVNGEGSGEEGCDRGGYSLNSTQREQTQISAPHRLLYMVCFVPWLSLPLSSSRLRLRGPL